MRCSKPAITHLESRLSRRLSFIGARRIALFGAGFFADHLLEHIRSSNRFASAEVVAVIDESESDQSARIRGFPIVGSVREADCDAVVVSTPMHEPGILRRARGGAFGDIPVIGLHDITDPQDLAADTLLLAETGWFSLDLPGILEQFGRSFVIASAMGLPGFDRVRLAPFWAAHANAPIDRITWDSLDLYDIVQGSAACLLGRARIDPDADRDTLIRLMDEAIRVYESAKSCFIGEHAPGNAVVANGLFHHQRAVAEAALRTGVPVFVIESSCFPDRNRLAQITNGTPSGDPRVSVHQDRALTEPQRSRVLRYLNERKPHRERRPDTAPQPAPATAEQIRSELGIPEDHRVLLLLGQVCTDTSLVYDAPLINDVARLSSIASSIVGRLGGWTLLIKPHPKEATGADPIAGKPYTQGAFDRLKDDSVVACAHVRLLEPCRYNVYSLMQLADAGLTISSQSAMEMAAMFGKPVCIVGRPPYMHAGFTRNATSGAQIEPTIAKMLERPALSTQEHERALRFVHDEVFERLTPTNALVRGGAAPLVSAALRSLLGGTPSAMHRVGSRRAAIQA